jgi:hypothetical protein
VPGEEFHGLYNPGNQLKIATGLLIWHEHVCHFVYMCMYLCIVWDVMIFGLEVKQMLPVYQTY